MVLYKWLERLKKDVNKVEDIPLEGDTSGQFKNELHKYVNIHKNQRCFVVGNGPSLNKIDMSLLENEITLGSNRVYLGFKKWGFHFTYWGMEDFLQIKQSYKELNKVLPKKMIKFVPRQYCYLFNVKNLCPVNFLYIYKDYPNFSDNSDALYTGYTITYMLLQIAVIMGCNPIYLIGIDYNYNITEKEEVGVKWSDPNSQSHFVSNYCAADTGRIWNVPQFDKTDASFECASNWTKAKNIYMLNATPGSKLEAFPKVSYDELFPIRNETEKFITKLIKKATSWLNNNSKIRCKLCDRKVVNREGYGRLFHECEHCGFIFSNDYNPEILNKGMGMEGSWSGPGGGGYREYYLVRMLIKDLNKKSFLLFGTGNTPTFEKLNQEGVDVTGCDISQDVVEYKVKTYGKGTFYVPGKLSEDKKYDGIIAVEVFEHFIEPKTSLNLLVNQLAEGGIICGTTNFYPGGLIEDKNNPGYMSQQAHYAYWSNKSMSYIANQFGLSVSAFEMVRPGSILPDEEFGQVRLNKRIFFLYDCNRFDSYFKTLMESTPILPIDKP